MRRLLAAALVVTTLLAGTVAYAERHALARRAHRVLAKLGAENPFAPPSQVEAMAGSVTVSVDPKADNHPISPLIYGVAKRDPSAVDGLGATLNRWGGNPSSRYNWVLGNAWNAADDWEFRNLDYGAAPGSESDRFVRGNEARSMASLITVPALGWVAKSTKNSDQSIQVPDHGGPAIDAAGAIAGYDPTANRQRTSVPSLPRKPGPFVLNPSPSSPVVYEDEWVNHLVTLFGRANAGGVRLYAVDNEPMLWSETHRDVHPAQMSYDDLASTFLTYSSAIKAVDPTASVVGPESYGWTDYFYSELDRGKDNFATHADRNAHGGTPLLPWFLQTVRQQDQKSGARSLDVLTVHYYPEARGVAGSKSDPATDALRLRSTRSLWDPTYVDESWIHDTVRLIPRLKEWVAQDYPGTKVGITEYNFGGGDSISAGLAEVLALGIFGREDLYLATYWTAPKPGTPAWLAFQLFRNYDGKGGAFGSTSVRAVSSAPGTVEAFGSREPGWVDLVLVNQDLQAAHDARLSLANARASGAIQRYELSGGRKAIARDADLPADTASLSLPAASATLLRIPVG